MPLTRDHLHRMLRVVQAQDVNFVELVGLAELDPADAFQGAILRSADLRGQDLGGFDFSGADFAGVDLRGADLSRSRGVTPDMLSDALYDSRTRLPPGFPNPFWAPAGAPSWVDDWGIDAHGRWVSFSVPAADGTRVTQRMRWIPPGNFRIGSPDDEPGRDANEEPQEEVKIADGFWMFDTACTRALWDAVTGKAPDPRRGAEFPVTNVSWTDVRDFVRDLNAAKPGLALSLPSEVRWEYACRAGTQTPYNFGAEISHVLVCYDTNAPVPVGSLPPNRWGLYEMHGNVWEWCADHWHDSYTGMPQDGSVWLGRKGAAYRVVRGGAWNCVANYVRAASRIHHSPTYRVANLGFRCARVQDNEQRQPERRTGRNKPSEQSETASTTSPTPETDKGLLEQKREQIISALSRHLGTTLIRKRGAYFWNGSHDQRIICTMSKRHEGRQDLYWFRYDRRWHVFLTEQNIGHLTLGCMGLQFAFVIPVDVISPLREKLHVTMLGDEVDYWHLNLIEPTPGSYALAVPHSPPFSLDIYRLPLK